MIAGKREKQMTETTMWYQPGKKDNDTLVLLKCPGREELLANHPVAGKTGENLCLLFRMIERKSNGCVSLCKQEVQIVNVSKLPHFKGSPYGEEVCEEELRENLEFVRQCVGGSKIRRIICCGKHAKAVLKLVFDFDKKLPDRISVMYICHLGDQGLLDGRRRYAWPDDADSVEKRVEYLAMKITEGINNNRGWSLDRGQRYVEFVFSLSANRSSSGRRS